MPPVHGRTKSLVHRALITTDPQKAIEEYYISRLEDQQIKKLPGWDVARAGPAAELVKARRGLAQAETNLVAKQTGQIQRRKVMDKQWDELRQKEILLRQSFIKFNKFAKENQDKRERAEHKINDEISLQAKRKEEIEEMKEKLEKMKNIRDNMEMKVKGYKMYQDYLERAVLETGQFQSIADVFSRYESLADAKTGLAVRQDDNLQALQDAGTEMVRLTDDKAQSLMTLNNRLALLQGRHDRAKVMALRWETTVSRIKATAAAKNLELTQVRTCCWNIYQQICRRKEIPVDVNREDVEHQLVHIKRTILELKRIARVARKKAAREEKDVVSNDRHLANEKNDGKNYEKGKKY